MGGWSKWMAVRTILMVALACVAAAAHFNVNLLHAPVRTKYVTVGHSRQGVSRNVTLTQEQCHGLPLGKSENDMVRDYGYPKGWEAGDDGFSLMYPITGDEDRYCIATLDYDDKVDGITLDLKAK